MATIHVWEGPSNKTMQTDVRLVVAADRQDVILDKTMNTWIALLRGVNVGGNNILPMAELREELDSIGLKNVRTYIQSGNIVFDSRSTVALSLGRKIANRIQEKRGFRPEVLLLTAEELRDVVEANPFPKAISAPKTLIMFFLAQPATNVNSEAIEESRSPSEGCHLTESVFYFHAPNGVGQSKLAAKLEKYLGVVTTGRNYRTVEKLLAMASGV